MGLGIYVGTSDKTRQALPSFDITSNTGLPGAWFPTYGAMIIALVGGVLLCMAIRNRWPDRIALNLVILGFGVIQVLTVLGQIMYLRRELPQISGWDVAASRVVKSEAVFHLTIYALGLLVVLILAALVNLSLRAQAHRVLAVLVMIVLVCQMVFLVLETHEGNLWDAIVRANGWGYNPAMTPPGWVMALLPLVMQVVMFAVLVLPLVTKAHAGRGAVSVGSTRRATAA